MDEVDNHVKQAEQAAIDLKAAEDLLADLLAATEAAGAAGMLDAEKQRKLEEAQEGVAKVAETLNALQIALTKLRMYAEDAHKRVLNAETRVLAFTAENTKLREQFNTGSTFTAASFAEKLYLLQYQNVSGPGSVELLARSKAALTSLQSVVKGLVERSSNVLADTGRVLGNVGAVGSDIDAFEVTVERLATEIEVTMDEVKEQTENAVNAINLAQSETGAVANANDILRGEVAAAGTELDTMQAELDKITAMNSMLFQTTQDAETEAVALQVQLELSQQSNAELIAQASTLNTQLQVAEANIV